MGKCRVAVLAWVLSACVSGMAAPASAQDKPWQPAGALTGHLLFADDAIGGGVMADLHIPVSVLRIGAELGVVALSSPDPDKARTLMPASVSLALILGSPSFIVDLRARGGMWAGAINDGLAAGGFLSAGGYLGIGLGASAFFTFGCDIWGLTGHGGAVVIAPGIGVAWTPVGDSAGEIAPPPDAATTEESVTDEASETSQEPTGEPDVPRADPESGLP